MSKKVKKEIPIQKNSELNPSNELVIDHLCLGTEQLWYETVNNGNTKNTQYWTYDFGIGVTNRSNRDMRIQMTLEVQGEDEYSSKKIYVWDDISPNSKKRIWSNFSYESLNPYRKILIKQIGIGSTPPEGKNGKSTWSSTSNPNKNLFELLQLSGTLTYKQKVRIGLGILALIAILLLWAAS